MKTRTARFNKAIKDAQTEGWYTLGLSHYLATGKCLQWAKTCLQEKQTTYILKRTLTADMGRLTRCEMGNTSVGEEDFTWAAGHGCCGAASPSHSLNNHRAVRGKHSFPCVHVSHGSTQVPVQYRHYTHRQAQRRQALAPRSLPPRTQLNFSLFTHS